MICQVSGKKVVVFNGDEKIIEKKFKYPVRDVKVFDAISSLVIVLAVPANAGYPSNVFGFNLSTREFWQIKHEFKQFGDGYYASVKKEGNVARLYQTLGFDVRIKPESGEIVQVDFVK